VNGGTARLLAKHGVGGRPQPIITQYFGGGGADQRSAPENWIYSGLRDLASRGKLGEESDPKQIGPQTTRFRLAALSFQATKNWASLDADDRQLVRRLCAQFQPEMRTLGLDPRAVVSPPAPVNARRVSGGRPAPGPGVVKPSQRRRS
jgi:hypothetical protein